MSTLVLLLLAGPVVVAVGAAILVERAPELHRAAAVIAAVGWVVVATEGAPVTAGDLVVEPVLAAAAAGLALLVAVVGSRSVLGACSSLLILAVVPAAAAIDPGRLPDRRYAAGLVLAGVLAALRLLGERGPRLAPLLVVLAAVVVATGLVGDDPGEAVALAAAGTTVAVAAAIVWGAPGQLIVPAALLALARSGPLRPAEEGLDVVLLLVAGLVVVGAVVLVVARARPATERLPLATVLAAAGLLALDVPELRAAGALLAAGAVLALAARHPLAIVAALPGLAAAVQSAGLATEPEQAAVGAAAVVALAAGAIGRTPSLPAGRPDLPVGLALAFAVIPLWGWSGADTAAYQPAAAVAVAVAVAVLVLVTGPWSDQLGPLAGRLRGRPRADQTDGQALDADSDAEEAHREAGATAP